MPNQNDWENPAVVGLNKQPGHVPLGAYLDANQAKSCDRFSSAFLTLLNGNWKFQLAASPEAVSAGFTGEGFRRFESGRDRRARQLAAAGYRTTNRSTPISIIPFHPTRPSSPRENPTGCYRHDLYLDPAWLERQVFLSFESVDSAFYLWVNGQKVGYSQDSRLPAEFDITPYVRAGREYPGGPGDALLRRHVPGRPGFLADERHPARCDPVQQARSCICAISPCAPCWMTATKMPISGDRSLHPPRARIWRAYRVEAVLYDAEGSRSLPARSSPPSANTPAACMQANIKDRLRHAQPAGRTTRASGRAETPYLYTLVLTLMDPERAGRRF